MNTQVILAFKKSRRTAVTMLLVLLMLAFGPMLAYASSGDQLWVARQPGDTKDIALDNSGNVYVAGFRFSPFYTTYTTTKYTAEGVLLWSRDYVIGGGGWPSDPALALDANDNAYITGRDNGNIVTIKYSSDGTQLWAKSHANGKGNDIAVDEAGNAYVTGQSTQNGQDFVTIKYDAKGKQKWIRTYDGPGNSNDDAIAIGLDADGNGYITGRSIAANGVTGYATIKYSTNGNQRWVERYDVPNSAMVEDLAVDRNGNVIITGWTLPSNSISNFVTIKYDSDGTQEWVGVYSAGGGEGYQAVALDGAGNTIVTFSYQDAANGFDIATIKYDASGNQLWARIFDGGIQGHDDAWDIAVDSTGNSYIVGDSDTMLGYSFITLKYDPDGTAQWVNYYNDNPYFNAANAVAVNASGVYVAGDSSYDDGRTSAIVKYAP